MSYQKIIILLTVALCLNRTHISTALLSSKSSPTVWIEYCITDIHYSDMAFVDRDMGVWNGFDHPLDCEPVDCPLLSNQSMSSSDCSMPPLVTTLRLEPTHPDVITIDTAFDPSAEANVKPLDLKKGDLNHMENTCITLEQQRLAEKARVIQTWQEFEELVRAFHSSASHPLF